MSAWVLIPFLLQGVAMSVDELVYHRRRGLPRWERIGHPLDTLSLLACAAWVCAVGYAPERIAAYATLSALSCLFVTKDEWVHQERCSAGEQWVHSLLFLLHPCVLASWGYAWSMGSIGAVRLQAWIILAFLAYQTFYWNFSWNPRSR